VGAAENSPSKSVCSIPPIACHLRAGIHGGVLPLSPARVTCSRLQFACRVCNFCASANKCARPAKPYLGGFSCKTSPGYTARMKQIIAAVVFIVIALWLGIYVVPDLIVNMFPGEP
jgi:hypothetical protein